MGEVRHDAMNVEWKIEMNKNLKRLISKEDDPGSNLGIVAPDLLTIEIWRIVFPNAACIVERHLTSPPPKIK